MCFSVPYITGDHRRLSSARKLVFTTLSKVLNQSKSPRVHSLHFGNRADKRCETRKLFVDRWSCCTSQQRLQCFSAKVWYCQTLANTGNKTNGRMWYGKHAIVTQNNAYRLQYVNTHSQSCFAADECSTVPQSVSVRVSKQKQVATCL